MARRFVRRIGLAVSVTAVVLSLSASVALAGEVTGTPGQRGQSRDAQGRVTRQFDLLVLGAE